MARAAPKSKKRPAPKSKKEEKKEEEVVDVSEDEQAPQDVDNGNAESDVPEEDEPPTKKGRGRPAANGGKKAAAKKPAAKPKGRASSGRKPAAKKEEKEDEYDEEEEYEVEKILDMRKRNKEREFFIKWKGYSKTKATWEPEDNLNCQDLIKEFEEKQEEMKNKPVLNLREEPKETKRYVDTADLKYERSERHSKRHGNSPRKNYREEED